jgi:L-aminopeptidase/D-esterase-like protein
VEVNSMRARDLGIPLNGRPGKWNAITDVAGVEVGQTTLLADAPRTLRCGVTAILPAGRRYDPLFAGWYTFNGCGEMTGLPWIEESGFLESGIAITNTASIGAVRDAMPGWALQHLEFNPVSMRDLFWFLPVAAETNDMLLNGRDGSTVRAEDVFHAFDSASGGPVAEGNTGGGTGMVCHEFKGGTGTASRLVDIEGTTYTLGALVQANYGERRTLTIAGVPVGLEITDHMPEVGRPWPAEPGSGSIIVILATDAPLLPHQLKRLARRAPLGIGRVGGLGTNGSGDLILAFSTAAPRPDGQPPHLLTATLLGNAQMNGLIEAVAEATEEAILNALVAAETMTGADGNRVYALPHERVIEILRKYGRI